MDIIIVYNPPPANQLSESQIVSYIVDNHLIVSRFSIICGDFNRPTYDPTQLDFISPIFDFTASLGLSQKATHHSRNSPDNFLDLLFTNLPHIDNPEAFDIPSSDHRLLLFKNSNRNYQVESIHKVTCFK